MASLPLGLTAVLPASLNDIEQAVVGLYQLTAPAEIRARDAQLQELQRSQFGWQLAFELCNAASHANASFFGALTFTIKLNQDGASLSQEQLSAVGEMLIHFWVLSVLRPDPSFVSQRFCSTLVTYFLIPTSPWQDCFDDLMNHLSAGEHDFDGETSSFAAHASDSKILALLTFAITLAEGLNELTANSQLALIHQRATPNVDAVACILNLLYDRFSPLQSHSVDPGRTVWPLIPKCHSLWTDYAHTHATEYQNDMFALLPKAASIYQALPRHADEGNAVAELITESINKSGREVPARYLEQLSLMLQSDTAESYFAAIQVGDVEDNVLQFGRMVIAFCKEKTRTVFALPHLPSDAVNDSAVESQVLEQGLNERVFIQGLSWKVGQVLNHDQINEDLAVEVISFWDDFVQEEVLHTDKVASQDFVLAAIPSLCQSARLPAKGASDSDEEETRWELRIRVSDFLEMAYAEYGSLILSKLLEVALQAWHWISQQTDIVDSTWASVESPVYLFVGLADSLPDFSHREPDDTPELTVIQSFFDSPVFASIANSKAPGRLRGLLFVAIGAFKAFFKVPQGYLERALDVIVACLDNEELATPAAGALKQLADFNRVELARRGQEFVAQLGQKTHALLIAETTEKTEKYKLVAAMSAVAQASRPPEQSGIIAGLLEAIESAFRTECSKVNGDLEATTSAAATLLESLAQIGEYSQVPTDDDLDDPDEEPSEEALQSQQYWLSDPGRQLQRRIIATAASAFDIDRQNPLLLDTICRVLKSGYREKTLGPFTFPPEITVNFITNMPIDYWNNHVLLKTAADLISSMLSTGNIDENALTALLTHTIQIMTLRTDPCDEPDEVSDCLEIVNRLTHSRSIHLISASEAGFTTIFTLVLSCLNNPEPRPKFKAAAFLSAIIARADTPAAPDRTPLRNAILATGPVLMYAFVNNFAGNAARSELDKLCDPFRKLTARFAEARTWLTLALDPASNAAFPSQRVTDAEKRAFRDQVLMLRGGVKVKEVVKEFWVRCRGTVTGYG